ncbi:MAG: adenylate/guanylate cyclase domain-containing protein, partial [Bacteroidota bacterium]|nr:adenylate/guanylate cyclase domain-containing protein [Bacteroidota bacterium]
MKETRKLAAVMFTDIVGYTALMSRDEQGALSVLQKNRDIQKPLVKKFNGEFLKEMGDGTLLCFQSALDAVQCAQEIQQSVSDDPDLNLRIGIHLGDIVFKESDIYGDGVNVASRIEHLAGSGGIFISDQIYNAIRNKPGIKAVFVGEKMLKNISHPVKVYSVISEGLLGDTTKQYQKTTKTKEKNTWKIVLPAVLAILIILMALYLVFKNHSDPKKPPITDINNITWKNSIAVLPFADMSPDKDQEYFCEGMAEEIINALSHITGLRVVARTSAFSFKGKDMDIREIGKQLNVGVILEGSVRKSGDNLRVTAQLINIEDGYHLWSEKYEKKLEDVFAIQDEISLAIVDKLKVKLLRNEKNALVKRYTENKEAYNLYLKGRYFWNRRSEVGFDKALGLFQSAIEIDPNFALAYASLAECYCMLSMHMAKPEPIIRKGRIAAEKALSIDETLGEAHTALAWIKFFYDWDWLGAERSFKKAIQLNPRYATAYNWYAVSLSIFNRHEEAIRYMTQAQEYDPGSAIINRNLGVIYAWAGEYQKALDQLLFTIDMDPDFAPAYHHIGVVYLWMKKYDLAIENFKKVRAMTGDFFDIIGILGFAYAKSGQKEEALSELEKLEDLAKNQDARAFEFSLIHYGLGNNDQAFKWLDIVCRNHEFGAVLLGCESELWFEDLLPDPRFQEFLIKIG